MAVNYEKYNAEYDAILNTYKPIIKKNFIIGAILGAVALVFLIIVVCLIFNLGSGKETHGKLIIGLLIAASALSSIMGKFMSKRTAARREMNRELRQLEMARKQASISE